MMNKYVKLFLIEKKFKAADVPDQYKTKEMRDKIVSKKPEMLKYCPDRYKNQQKCDKAVHACLSVSIKICFLFACFE